MLAISSLPLKKVPKVDVEVGGFSIMGENWPGKIDFEYQPNKLYQMEMWYSKRMRYSHGKEL